MSKSQTILFCKFIIKEFGPYVQNIDVVDNILEDMLNILSYKNMTDMIPLQEGLNGRVKFDSTNSIIELHLHR